MSFAQISCFSNIEPYRNRSLRPYWWFQFFGFDKWSTSSVLAVQWPLIVCVQLQLSPATHGVCI